MILVSVGNLSFDLRVFVLWPLSSGKRVLVGVLFGKVEQGFFLALSPEDSEVFEDSDTLLVVKVRMRGKIP